MSDIHIHRVHHLGLPQAREVARRWTEAAQRKFDMRCTWMEGESSDTVEFTRTGVKGQLIVTADHFDLKATLGFLLGGFAKTIEGEIEKNLDDLLAKKESGVSAPKGPGKAAGAPTRGRKK